MSTLEPPPPPDSLSRPSPVSLPEPAPKPLEFSADEQAMIQACRPKQVRGYCCLFVGSEGSTNYFGYNWREAIFRLLVSLKQKAKPPASAADQPVDA